MRQQFHVPKYTIGQFAYWHGAKVKLVALRWDSAHQEFQYQIRASGIYANTAWVSERNVT